MDRCCIQALVEPSWLRHVTTDCERAQHVSVPRFTEIMVGRKQDSQRHSNMPNSQPFQSTDHHTTLSLDLEQMQTGTVWSHNPRRLSTSTKNPFVVTTHSVTLILCDWGLCWSLTGVFRYPRHVVTGLGLAHILVCQVHPSTLVWRDNV